jgi:TRAP-type mannitol/chloroaromatic compound transport system permease small subunit
MIEKIERVLTRVDRLNEIVGWLAGAVLLISMVLVPYEVIMRYFFNNPTSWSMELTQYLFCTMVALGGGWVLLTKGHVNVDIVTNRLGVRARAVLDIVTSVLLFTLLFLLFWQSLASALQSMAWGETSASGWNPPIYPIKFIIPIGILLIILQSVAALIRNVIQAVTGIENNVSAMKAQQFMVGE